MSAAGTTPAAAPSLRRLPFTVGVAPTFANPLIAAAGADFLRLPPGGGLLFGIRDNGSVLLRRAFPFQSGSMGNLQMFESAVAAADQDDELKNLSVIGWYAQRGSGGLLEEDIAFHNQHFSKTSDLAMIVRPDGPDELICEIYSRSAEGLLSEEGHRWGLLGLNRRKPLSETVEITMRGQMRDDFFLRAYQQSYETSVEPPEGSFWRRAVNRMKRGPKELEESPAVSAAPQEPTPAPASMELPRKPAEQLQRPSNRPQTFEPAARSNAVDPKDDPLSDVTREMPREIALKALGLLPDPVAAEEKQNQPKPAIKEVIPIKPERPPAPRSELPIPAPQFTKPQPSRRSMWVSVAAVFAVTAALTFAVVHYRLLPSSSFASTNAPSPLGLRLEGQGDRILVTWNRTGALAVAAGSGELTIDDGGQSKTLPLDASQIRHGSVLYRPASADVTFRLQVTSREGKQAEETGRVLDASNSRDEAKIYTVDAMSHPPPSPVRKPAAARKNTQAPSQPSTVPPRNDKEIEMGSVLPQNAAPQREPATETSGTNTAPTGKDMIVEEPPARLARTGGDTPSNSSPSNYRPPYPTHQVLPNLRQIAPAIPSKNGAQVEVTVNVDKAGRVVAARLTNNRQLNASLSDAALTAARSWTFDPASMNGQLVASEHAIIFNFRPPSR